MTQQEFDNARVLKGKIDAIEKQIDAVRNVQVNLDSNNPVYGLEDIVYNLLKVNEGKHLISALLEKVVEDLKDRLQTLNTQFANL